MRKNAFADWKSEIPTRIMLSAIDDDVELFRFSFISASGVSKKMNVLKESEGWVKKTKEWEGPVSSLGFKRKKSSEKRGAWKRTRSRAIVLF